MEKTFSIILKIRWIIVLTVVSITLFLGYQIPGIKINSDVISSLPDDDPDAVLLKKIGARFGGNRMGMIILTCDNVFDHEILNHVKKITDVLADIEGISSITSLTNIMDIKEDAYGMEIGKLVDEDELPESIDDLAILKERVMSKEMYKGVIVSEDAKATLILFSLVDEANIREVANEVKSRTDALHLPEQIYYAGSPMMITSISHLIATDLKRLLPVAFLLIALSLFIGFRTVKGLILPLLTATIAIIWVIGIMALLGYEMSMVSNNIPIVLLAIGTAYSIHVLNRIGQLRGDLNKTIIIALSSVAIPVLLAALTTMTGFVSFIFGSYLSMIRDFGIFTALGTFIAVTLSLFFVPALISLFSWNNRTKKVPPNDTGNSYYFDLVLNPLRGLLLNHTNKVLVIWIMLTMVSVWGVFLIKRNVDIRNYFRKDNPTRIAEDIMNEKFGGTKPIFVLFRGDIQSPELLQTMLLAEAHMKESPYVLNTQSIAELIVEMNAALGEGREIPDEKEKIEQLWFLFEGNETIRKFVSDDLDEAIIISKFLSPDNNAKKDFGVHMNSFIEEHSAGAFTIEVTGMPFIDITMDRSLINSQMSSLTIALMFVILIVGLFLRSLVAGIYAAIPIISGIIILFGMMGYTGIPLNIATVLVASIAMGIGIDYSIHVITHFNDAIEKGASVSAALEDMIGISGKAIIINVISVSVGFLVLLFSEMVPLQYFGLLIFLSMVGSGLSALTLLPVILILAHKRRKSIQLSDIKN
ncbi:MAG: efflux RND transporter permease subunit [Bacteroidales bacterium]